MLDRFLLLPEVVALTRRSKPTIYRMIKEGSFPAQRKLGLRTSGWLASEVQQWILDRPVGGGPKHIPGRDT